MDALDIISLEQAKDFLEVDFPDKDPYIEGIIKSAIAWVEKYTGYALYERDVNVSFTGCEMSIVQYPLKSITAKDKDNVALTNLKTRPGALRTYVSTYSWCGSTLSYKAGYASGELDQIPQPLIDGAYKLIAYLYDNHSAYSSSLPVDIQLLINQYRRSATL